MPLSNSSFERYAEDYAKSEIEGIPSENNSKITILKRIQRMFYGCFVTLQKLHLSPFLV